MVFRTAFAAAALAIATAVGLPAFAQTDENVVRAVTRAQTLIDTLGTPQGEASATYQLANTRLEEARAAQASDDSQAAVWRAEEAALQAEIAAEQVRLTALRDRETELRDAVSALRRELDR